MKKSRLRSIELLSASRYLTYLTYDTALRCFSFFGKTGDLDVSDRRQRRSMGGFATLPFGSGFHRVCKWCAEDCRLSEVRYLDTGDADL